MIIAKAVNFEQATKQLATGADMIEIDLLPNQIFDKTEFISIAHKVHSIHTMKHPHISPYKVIINDLNVYSKQWLAQAFTIANGLSDISKRKIGIIAYLSANKDISSQDLQYVHALLRHNPLSDIYIKYNSSYMENDICNNKQVRQFLNHMRYIEDTFADRIKKL